MGRHMEICDKILTRLEKYDENECSLDIFENITTNDEEEMILLSVIRNYGKQDVNKEGEPITVFSLKSLKDKLCEISMPYREKKVQDFITYLIEEYKR